MEHGICRRPGPFVLAFIAGWLALHAAPAAGDQTPVQTSSEPSLVQPGGILDQLYGLSNLVRIEDFNADPNDQLWTIMGPAGATATAKFAGLDQDFGYFTGESPAAPFVSLFTVGGFGFVTGPTVAFGPAQTGSVFRFGLNPSSGDLFSSRISDNTTGDHMVTWLIVSSDATHPNNPIGSYAIGWEDVPIPAGPPADPEPDYNDLVLELSSVMPAMCGDGLLNGTETCDDGNTTSGDCCSATCQIEPNGTLCRAAADVCDVAELCDGVSDTCPADASQPDGTACDDATVCNGAETCQAGACAPGLALDCDDANPCTADSCDAISGCQNVPVAAGTPCDDATVCNGAETCDAGGTCQPGTALACDDGNDCTADSCDALSGCQNAAVADGTLCDDSNACTTGEACLAGACAGGVGPSCDDGNPCTADSCDLVLGCQNVPVAAGTSCSDANLCNGSETCDAGGTCQPGTALVCNDGNVCTADSCNPGSGCANLPVLDGTPCDDATVCNGAETCQSGTCQAGSPLVCDNGQFCDGSETCDALSGCQAGTPVSCDDGFPCTLDTCDEVGDACLNATRDFLCDDGIPCTVDTCSALVGCQSVGDDALCSNGEFCDGAEICNPLAGCEPGFGVVCPDDGFSCTEELCDAVADQCIVDNTCQCGNGAIEPGELCDPPSGLEDCNNFIDDDGDNRIDCADTDCQDPANPNVGIDTCGEDCTVDLACQKILKDPARVVFGRNGRLDRFMIHGRIALNASMDLSTAGLAIMLENADGVILQESLAAGQFEKRGTWYKFKNPDARKDGGFLRARFKQRQTKGIEYIHFVAMSFGDYSAATLPTMTTQIVIGSHTATLTRDWTPKANGWKLANKDF